jgi:hypothetical protein
MTTLIDQLKNIRTIQPDPAYTARSRRLLIGAPAEESSLNFRPSRMLWHGIQSGSALALASILILVIAESFSFWKFASPLPVSSLDPAALRAEAQAIDIQIQLTGIAYPESGTETTVAVEPDKHRAQGVEKLSQGLGVQEGTPTSSLTIGDVLDRLAE